MSYIAGDYSKEFFYEANGFYRQQIRKKQLSVKNQIAIEQDIVRRVQNIRMEAKGKGTGARVLYSMLNITSVGINKFEKILSRNNLGIKIKKRRIVTTDGLHESHDKNLINGLILTDINQVISGDITYLIIGDKAYYVFTLKDMYSKRVLSIRAFETMHAINALLLLKDVKRLRGNGIFGCIHHTDAGSQYKAKVYICQMKKMQLQQSIAKNCLQNGMAEQLNDQIKNRFLKDKIKNLKQLNRELLDIKKAMNESIPKKILGYKTPVEFENELKTIPLENRLKIEIYDFNNQNTSKGDVGTLGEA